MDDSEYGTVCKNWQRARPEASEEEVHKLVLGHAAWKRHSIAKRQKETMSAPNTALFMPTQQRAPWELRAIAFILAIILLVLLVAVITKAAPDPPLPLPFNRVMMMPQVGTVPIPLPVRGSGSANPVYVICSSGCSAGGSFADNSAFTVGTTPGSILFGYYTTGGAPTLTNGSAARARIDASSYLYVDCATGCSSSSFQDNSSFTAGTTSIGITGGWYAASPTACTSGNACAPSMTSDRKMFVQSFQGTSPWVVSNGGTFAVQAAQSGTWTVTGAGGTFPVTGTVTANAGTNLNTSALQLDTTGASLNLAQASTTSGQTGPLVQGATTTSAPTYTTAKTNPLSLDTAGNLRVTNTTAIPAGTNVIGHVIADSGSTTAVTQATAANLNATVVGAGTAGSANAGVVTVQGIASMTKLLVTPDSVALPANQSVNVSQLNGTTTDTNSGNKSAGTLRVVLATDQPQLTNKLLVTPDANSSVNLSQVNAHTVIEAGVNGSQAVGGCVATNTATPCNPMNLGAQAVSSENSAATTAREVQLVADLVGKLIVLPYANPENFETGVTAVITDTTSTAVIASAGGSLRNYITSCKVTNSHATVGTFVKILDGATIIDEGYAAPAGGGWSTTYTVPLRGTAATAVNAQAVTTGANFIVSCQGYKGV